MTADHWSTVESCFHEALTRSDREAFLTALDEPVRGEVESLLAAHEATEIKGTIDRTNWIGKRVGPYRIIREIGRGGMGAIYLAHRDDEAFRKDVAVKVIKRGMDSDAIVRRFRNERQILADLDHPNIARLFDGGTTDDGLPFFVMEYIDGAPLDEYCRDLKVHAKLRLFATVCKAVAYAQSRGVVHRDLKPSNILVTKPGEVKLLDFGIAKVFDDSRDQTLTAAGHQVLTPAYASPEQLTGDQATPASDVYSLGIILRELLHDERVPRDVKTIVQTATNAERARRYATAEDLGADIGRYLAGEAIVARPQRLYRAFRTVRRHRAAVMIAILICALAVVLLRKPAAPQQRTAAAVELVPLTNFTDVGNATISSDGKFLAYRRSREGRGIWIRDLQHGTDRRVSSPGPSLIQTMALSNDNRVLYLAAFAADAPGRIDLVALPTSGEGDPHVVRTAAGAYFGLSPDGKRAVIRQEQRIVIVDLSTGRDETIATWKKSEPLGPIAWAADGKTIVFSVDHAGKVVTSDLLRLDLATRAYTRIALPKLRVRDLALLHDGSGAVALCFVEGQNVQFWMIPWTGSPIRISNELSEYLGVSLTAADAIASVRMHAPSNVYEMPLGNPDAPLVPLTAGDNYFGRNNLGFLPDGDLLFNDYTISRTRLFRLHPQTKELHEIPLGVDFHVLKISPDQRHIGFISNASGINEVWVANLDGSQKRQVTHHGWVAQFDFSQNGNAVVYATNAEQGIFETTVVGDKRQKISNLRAIGPGLGNPPWGGTIATSSNGNFAAFRHYVPGQRDRTAVLNLHDHTVRFLDAPEMLTSVPRYAWMPDSSGVIVLGGNQVWLEPLDGSPMRRFTHLKTGSVRWAAVSPDMKTLAVAWGPTNGDAVMIRNFR